MATQTEHRAQPATDVDEAPPTEQPRRMPSGRVLIRMPRSLHQRLLDQAAEEGVSANQLAVAILSRGLA